MAFPFPSSPVFTFPTEKISPEFGAVSIPVPVPIPGVKLGLANVIVIIMLYFMDAKSAFFVSLIRVLLSGLLFAGFAGMLYSMAGALCSFAVMVLLQKTGKFSIIGVSVAGGIFHNVGQIVVASLVVQNVRMAYYLPFLLVSGVVTGVLIGIGASCGAYLCR